MDRRGLHQIFALLVFVSLFYITPAQDFFGFSQDQERIRCIGVSCPSDRPRCVIENRMARCVAVPSDRNNNNRNRLSRPAPPPQSPTPSAQQQRNSNGQLYEVPQSGTLGFPTSLSNTGFGGINNNNIHNNNNNDQVRNTAPRQCFQRPEKGNCEAYFPRYFYNPASRRCESFVYGGCGGNSNNFETLLDCFKTCSLSQTNANAGNNINGKLNQGNSNNNNNAISNFNDNRPNSDNSAILGGTLSPLLLDNNLFFSQPQNDFFTRPLNSVTNGGQGNTNRQKAGSQSQQPSPNGGGISGFAPGAPPPPPRLCSLKKEGGLCFAAMPRYFNSETQKCESFLYGGCGGNENNFESLEGCNSVCNYYDEYVAKQSRGGSEGLDYLQSGTSGKAGANQGNANSNPFVNSQSATSNLPSQNTQSRTPSQNIAPRNPSSPPRSCFLAADQGPCLARYRKYYYDPNTQRCQAFFYGGCGGNQNNFDNVGDCRRDCESNARQQSSGQNNFQGQLGGPPSGNNNLQSNGNIQGGSNIQPQGSPQQAQEVCILSPDAGPCFGRIQRYFYNSRAGRCQTFDYGGCQGNGNNFDSLITCRKACDSPQPQRNVDLAQQIPAMTPSTSVSDILQFALPSNLGFFNPFDNFQQQPANTDINRVPPSQPSQPLPSGTTTNSRPSNQNQGTKPSICYLDSQTGPCRAYIPRYFFNKNTGQCESFVYGGCQSNQNNFATESECRQVCSGSVSNSGSNNFGNNNRDPQSPLLNNQKNKEPFGSFRLTQDSAGGGTLTIRNQNASPGGQIRGEIPRNTNAATECSGPADPGDCFDHIPSFYFNLQSGACEPFVYNGCGGNQNRYSSYQQCQSVCGSNRGNRGANSQFPSPFTL